MQNDWSESSYSTDSFTKLINDGKSDVQTGPNLEHENKLVLNFVILSVHILKCLKHCFNHISVRNCLINYIINNKVVIKTHAIINISCIFS